MSFLSGALSVVRKVAPVARVIPGLNTAIGAVGLATTAYGAYKAVKGSTPTAMSGLPPLPGISPTKMGLSTIPQPGQTGGLSVFSRGPGNKLQLPWNDPSTPAFLKQFALDDSFIKLAMRAPKGYVIVHDAQGRAYPLLKKIAMQYHLWRPAKKPPISVKDWSALKRADKVVHKMKKIVTMSTRVDHHVGKGGKVHFTKHKHAVAK